MFGVAIAKKDEGTGSMLVKNGDAVTFNAFYDNAHNRRTVDAKNNWWGSSNGPKTPTFSASIGTHVSK